MSHVVYLMQIRDVNNLWVNVHPSLFMFNSRWSQNATFQNLEQRVKPADDRRSGGVEKLSRSFMHELNGERKHWWNC